MKQLISALIFNIFIAMTGYSQNQLFLTVNGVSKAITLADTKAARQLGEKVKSGTVTLNFSDYGGFEKVGALPWSLPTENRPTTTTAGDIMLYQGNNMVIFYGSNSWSYTPLGRLEGMTAAEIKSFLAGSNITATITADDNSGINEIESDPNSAPSVYTLQGIKIDMTGRSIDDLPKGIYIINGKKEIIK